MWKMERKESRVRIVKRREIGSIFIWNNFLSFLIQRKEQKQKRIERTED